MLAFPGPFVPSPFIPGPSDYTRAIIDSLLDDQLSVHPMEFMMPRQRLFPKVTQRRNQKTDSAVASLAFGTPTVKDGKYSLALDLHQFKPEEVQVQMDNERMLKVTGRREVKSEDGASYELREYTHHFLIPENVQEEQISVKLDANGRLAIQAPLKQPEVALDDGVKSIPIEFVGKQ